MDGISFQLALIIGVLIFSFIRICEYLESIEQLLKELKRERKR